MYTSTSSVVSLDPRKRATEVLETDMEVQSREVIC